MISAAKKRTYSAKEIEDLVERLCRSCRDAGLKVTQQRIGLFEGLLSLGRHLSAEELFEHLRGEYKSLSLSTVYNTLQTLAGLGVIGVIRNPNGPTLYDPCPDPHHHLFCKDCGEVMDVFMPGVVHIDQSQIDKDQFEIDSFQLTFLGRCPECLPMHRAAQEA